MFDRAQKRLESLGYKVYTDKVTGPKGDVVASIDPYGALDTKDEAILRVLKEPVAEPKEPVVEVVKKKVAKKK